MGLTLRGEKPEGRTRNVTKDETTYQRVFVVATDNDHIGAREVSFCPGLPFLGYQYNTGYEVDPLVRVISRSAQPVGNSRRVWEVTVNYSSKHDDPEEENTEEESLELEPPEVSFDFATRMKVVQRATQILSSTDEGVILDNEYLSPTTSAGEPFDPPPEIEEHFPVLTITRNERFLNMEQIREYVNVVNSDNFQGGGPRTVKINGISARKQYKKNLRYWRTTYTLEFNPATWDLQLLDIGSYSLRFVVDPEDIANVTTERVYFLTDDDPPQPRLGLLDGQGNPLSDGGTPVFRRFPNVYTARPFNVLQLDGALNF
jgi:hypothetical protein